MKKILFTIISIHFLVVSSAQTTYNYLYDDLNRLVKVTYGNGTVITYAYDQLGNRTAKQVTPNVTALPDLSPTGGSLSSSSVAAGGSITVTWVHNNLGTAAAGAFATPIYLSTNNSWDVSDVQLAIENTTNLNGGAMPSISKSVTIPGGTTAGAYFLLVFMDKNAVVTEISEANNVLAIPVTVSTCSGFSLINPSTTSATCNLANGSASITPQGGTAPYQYAWNSQPVQTSATATNLSAGTYTVTVTTATGCTQSATLVVASGTGVPIPGFTFSISGNTATFTNTSSNATTYAWTFGNGATSSATNPTQTYATSGTYNVCLTASNTACGSQTYCQSITIGGANSCGTPTGISATALGNTTATIGWTGVSGADNYNMIYRPTGSTQWQSLNSLGNVTTYILTTLVANTSYELQLQAVCSGILGGFSTSYYFSTGVTVIPYFKSYQVGTSTTLDVRTTMTNDGFLIQPMRVNVAGNTNAYLTKINPQNGNVIASKEFDTANTDDYLLRGAPTSDNGAIFRLQRNALNNPVWVKFTAALDVEFAKSITLSGAPAGHSFGIDRMIQAADGGYFVAGEYSTNAGVRDLYVAKFTSAFTLSWAKRLSINTNDSWSCTAILKTSDNGYLLQVIRYLVPDLIASDDYLVKITDAGTVTWAKRYFANNGTYLSANTGLFENSTHFFSGIATSFATNTTYPQDAMLLKVDKTNGNAVWVKHTWSNGKMLPMANNNIMVNGFNRLVTIDANGALVSNKKVQHANLNWLDDIYLTPYGNVVGTGGLAGYGKTVLLSFDNNLSNCATSAESITIADYTSSVSQQTVTFTEFSVAHSVAPYTSFTPAATTITVANVCAPPCPVAGIAASATTICQGSTVTLSSSGTGATTYAWRVGTGAVFATTSTATYTFTNSGTYTVYLDVSDGVCTTTAQVIITVNAAPIISSITNVSEQCGQSNGTATIVFAPSNASINWSNGATTATITGLAAGNYAAFVTDAAGCVSTLQSTTIANTSNGFSTAATVTNISCFGKTDGIVLLSHTNTVGTVTYNWSNSTTTNPAINLAEGTYTVTISDAAGCSMIRNYTITEPVLLQLKTQVTDITDCGLSNGTATAIALGGTPPIAYNWSNGQTNATAIGLVQANYFITITDSRGCTDDQTATVGTLPRTQDIKTLYSNQYLGGITNAIVYNGKISTLLSKEPQDSFPGYPDPNTDFFKLDLYTEGSPLVPVEATGAAASLVHGNIAVTADGKLAITYQAPTGTMYGFKGVYKRYDTNNALVLNQNVFTNANWGAWMRNIETPNDTITTRLVSFSHAGYYPMIHKRHQNGNWINYYIHGPNIYVGNLSAAKDNSTNEVHVSGRWGYGTQTPKLRYYKLNLANSLTGAFTDFSIPIQNSCDLKMNPSNYPGLLFYHNNKLKLYTQTAASTWSLDSLIYQKGVEHRASLFYRTNGTAVVAYQTEDKVVVIQKNTISGLWDVLFTHNNLLQTEFVGSTEGPSLLLYCGDLHVVYNDGQNIYKMNIDRPCNFVAVAAKVILQGPYNTTTTLMNDNLRTMNLIPTAEPYTGMSGFTHVGGGGESVHTSVFSKSGNDAIVDWVFVELRSASAPTTVVATRSALIQRDGDIVDCDGFSPIVFKNVIPGNYYFAVKHRNHLAIRTPIVLNLNRIGVEYNFTTAQSQAYQNTTIISNPAMKDLGGSKFGLWRGNSNSDNSINIVDFAQTKSASTPNQANVYQRTDINMDGNINVVDPAIVKSQSTPNKSSHN
jgi:YD repeat-containing protein